jgi:ubiquinone/menaquinone biosynthesis C-methylase UbiE
MIAKNPKNDIQRFDQWSHSYEDSWMQKRLFDPVHQAILTLAAKLDAPGTVLDVGCGTGRLLRAASTYWPQARLIGVDPADGMIEVARKLNPAATFLSGTSEALPLPDNSVDLALSTLSFHHWHDQAAGVREIARVLRPNGYFFLGDASGPAWISKVITHDRFLDRNAVKNFFRQANLEVLAQQPVHSRFVVVTVGMKRPGNQS